MMHASDLNQQHATPMFSAFLPATNFKEDRTRQQNQRLIVLVQIEEAAPATSKPGSRPAQHATIGPTMSRSRFE
jgi:hypothetical protein